jgi:hypothetical protein
MNAIAVPEPTTMPMAFSDMERLAEHVAKSNLFGMKTKEQALVLMMVSHAEGRHPVLAARDYDVIQGRPAKKSEAMLRDFLQAGGRVEWHALSDDIADATFTHPQGGSARISWNMDRANKAGMAGKDNWKKFPRQMLRSRTVSEGVRTVFPLATSGLYVPEEVADFAGQTIEAEASPERQAINDEVPLRAAAAPMPRGARVAERARAYEAPPKRMAEEDAPEYADIYAKHDIAIELLDEPNPQKWMDSLEMLLANAQTQEAVVVISDHDSVKRAIALAPNGIKARVSELLANAYKRFVDESALDPETVPA